jgi:hypothetical protein
MKTGSVEVNYEVAAEDTTDSSEVVSSVSASLAGGVDGATVISSSVTS